MIADLRGKVALVTGAGSGIGAAVVRWFVEQGASVLATDISVVGVEQLAGELGYGTVTPVPLDVTDASQANAVVSDLLTKDGRIDILVCSAGVVLAEERELAPDTPADWDRCFAVNVRGTVNTCEAVIPGRAEVPL